MAIIPKLIVARELLEFVEQLRMTAPLDGLLMTELVQSLFHPHPGGFFAMKLLKIIIRKRLAFRKAE